MANEEKTSRVTRLYLTISANFNALLSMRRTPTLIVTYKYSLTLSILV